MAFDFPSAPATGQIYQPVNGPTYVYDGSLWRAQQYATQVPIAAPGGVCRVSKTANQSIPSSGIPALLTWDTEQRDDYNAHSTTSNTSRITVPAGIYYARFRAHVTWAANSTGARQIYIRRNAAGDFTTPAGTMIGHDVRTASNESSGMADTGLIAVTPGDYYEAGAYQTSGGALNVIAAAASFADGSFFEAEFYTGTVASNGGLTLIEQWTSAGGETSKTFSSLGTYTDLVVAFNGAISNMAQDLYLYFNADSTAANYRSYKRGVASVGNYSGAVRLHAGEASSAASPAIATGEATVHSYRNTSFYKRAMARYSFSYASGNVEQGEITGQWLNAAAITSLLLSPSGGTTFVAGTTITLYGRG
jgi:hypothetical protein